MHDIERMKHINLFSGQRVLFWCFTSQSTIFQSCPDDFQSSWVEPVQKKQYKAKDKVSCSRTQHNTVTPVSLELASQYNTLPKEPLQVLKWNGMKLKHMNIKDKIRIYHECEGEIGKSVPMITIWHHEWWQTVIPSDGFFYPTLTQLSDSFSCSLDIAFYVEKRLPEVPKYAEMRHIMMTSL